jgi:hypothetical protein
MLGSSIFSARTEFSVSTGTRLSSETVTEGFVRQYANLRFGSFCRCVALLPSRGKRVRSRLPVSWEESEVL